MKEGVRGGEWCRTPSCFVVYPLYFVLVRLTKVLSRVTNRGSRVEVEVEGHRRLRRTTVSRTGPGLSRFYCLSKPKQDERKTPPFSRPGCLPSLGDVTGEERGLYHHRDPSTFFRGRDEGRTKS